MMGLFFLYINRFYKSIRGDKTEFRIRKFSRRHGAQMERCHLFEFNTRSFSRQRIRRTVL